MEERFSWTTFLSRYCVESDWRGSIWSWTTLLSRYCVESDWQEAILSWITHLNWYCVKKLPWTTFLSLHCVESDFRGQYLEPLFWSDSVFKQILSQVFVVNIVRLWGDYIALILGVIIILNPFFELILCWIKFLMSILSWTNLSSWYCA